eukprot:TRINITY_DN9982_c0_g1_i1.p1 TRINITY_DN9982_c0_g1~~TRINITY_DN9982_c0_g1_i1.p1  ORF type:complete len:339 (-),score=77.96 TRINITY_DN9982_c0_g1_i1:35-979(-)
MARGRGARGGGGKAAGGPEASAGRGGTSGSGDLVRGYKLLRTPFAAGLPLSRNLLVKRHQARDAEERASQSRTLFVTHLDAFATEATLTKSFSAGYGPVERVELKTVEKKAPKVEQRADGVRVYVTFARVIFKDAVSVEKALADATGRIAGTSVLPLPASELRERLRIGGDAAYREAGELRKEVDKWMAQYDEHEAEKRRLAKESAIDDDGFTKVVSGITRTTDGVAIRAAKRPDVMAGAFAEPIRGIQDPSLPGVQGNNPKKKKKSKEMPDFYRFQLREKKRTEIIDHRKRQAVDTEKVEYMKKKKKFKANSS